MRIPRLMPTLIILLCLLCSSLLIGCGTQNTPIETTSADNTADEKKMAAGSDRAIPPIVLTNPTPDQLDVIIDVIYSGYASLEYDNASIGLMFSSQGQNVQFAGTESLVCNGKEIALPRDPVGGQSMLLADDVTSKVVGQDYSCTYTVGEISSTFSFHLLQAPTILTPEDNTDVQRNSETVVTYNVNHQDGVLMSVVALGEENKAYDATNMAETQAVLDTSDFAPGKGQITLNQSLDIRGEQSGAEFKSLSISAMAQYTVFVNWV